MKKNKEKTLKLLIWIYVDPPPIIKVELKFVKKKTDWPHVKIFENAATDIANPFDFLF